MEIYETFGHSRICKKTKKPQFGGLEHDRFANILNRNFHAEKPMQKVVTDVTYIKYRGKWHYFACYLDLFNNEILDYELSDIFDNFLVMKPAKRIFEKQRAPKSKSFCTATIVYYFNYIKPVRKLKEKPPVQYRLEQAA